MRAIVVADKNRAGIGTVETAAPGAGEIRVRVKAAALNRADLLVLAGHQHGSVGGTGAILGLECAGEVESLGQDATGFAIGDRVMCSARHAFAEYVVTDAGRATKIPSGMSFEEATTLPIALQTMHDALMTNGRPEERRIGPRPGRQLRRRPDGAEDRQIDGRGPCHRHLDQ
jgi:NADPH:quinone reductase